MELWSGMMYIYMQLSRLHVDWYWSLTFGGWPARCRSHLLTKDVSVHISDDGLSTILGVTLPHDTHFSWPISGVNESLSILSWAHSANTLPIASATSFLQEAPASLEQGRFVNSSCMHTLRGHHLDSRSYTRIGLSCLPRNSNALCSCTSLWDMFICFVSHTPASRVTTDILSCAVGLHYGINFRTYTIHIWAHKYQGVSPW